jgi:hypothetical protein
MTWRVDCDAAAFSGVVLRNDTVIQIYVSACAYLYAATSAGAPGVISTGDREVVHLDQLARRAGNPLTESEYGPTACRDHFRRLAEDGGALQCQCFAFDSDVFHIPACGNGDQVVGDCVIHSRTAGCRALRTWLNNCSP